MPKHAVAYVARGVGFTDWRLTDKVERVIQEHGAAGWTLVSAVGRVGTLGDITGMWLFFVGGEDAQEIDHCPEKAEVA
jgi:hypothetical protein